MEKSLEKGGDTNKEISTRDFRLLGAITLNEEKVPEYF